MEEINSRFVVYDNVQEDRELVSRVVSMFYENKNVSAEIHSLFDKYRLVDAFRHNIYYAIFMGMNSMDEVDAAWIIRKLAPKCPLIIMSVSGDYAMEGYRLEAFDYLVKPLDEEKINKTLERLAKEENKSSNNTEISEYIKGGQIAMGQLKAFLEKAGADSELTRKLEELGENLENPEALIAVAAEHGFAITAEEVEEAKSLTKKNELDEEELEEVAGGGRSVNRYCPEWCKNLTRHRIACTFPLCDCDHFKRENDSERTYHYWFSCAKGAFKKYKGTNAGNPV